MIVQIEKIILIRYKNYQLSSIHTHEILGSTVTSCSLPLYPLLSLLCSSSTMYYSRNILHTSVHHQFIILKIIHYWKILKKNSSYNHDVRDVFENHHCVGNSLRSVYLVIKYLHNLETKNS